MKKTILIFVCFFGFTAFPISKKKSDYNHSNNVNLATTLEAVLVVGNIQESTKSAIKEMDEIALLFVKNGVKVTKFYDKNANWESIKTASKTASFFVYQGHGTTLGLNGESGGLVISDFIYAKQIYDELKLNKNCLVLFKSVCRGAGSSAGDSEDIGINEATNRVSDYSRPFISIGASCYFADNFNNGLDIFLTEFFYGKNIEECYKAATKYDLFKVELKKPFKFDNKKQIYISSTNYFFEQTVTTIENGKKVVKKIIPFKEYDIALVGNPVISIKDLR